MCRASKNSLKSIVPLLLRSIQDSLIINADGDGDGDNDDENVGDGDD